MLFAIVLLIQAAAEAIEAVLDGVGQNEDARNLGAGLVRWRDNSAAASFA